VQKRENKIRPYVWEGGTAISLHSGGYCATQSRREAGIGSIPHKKRGGEEQGGKKGREKGGGIRQKPFRPSCGRGDVEARIESQGTSRQVETPKGEIGARKEEKERSYHDWA